MQDRIHQPYRKALISGYDAVSSAVMAAGAYGIVISGAGPTLLALANESKAAVVQSEMLAAWQQQGVNAEVKVLQIDNRGFVSTNL
ncbi:MAG: hypothetical protein NVS2B14_04920 [Chamaesiphon sp.]